MNIVDHCLAAYGDEDAVRNGIPRNIDNVRQMLELMRRFIDSAGATVPDLARLMLGPEDRFNKDNPADVLGLAFDALTELNRNPELWTELHGQSIHSEVLSVISVIFNGPHVLAPDPNRGVKQTNYPAAKAELLDLLAKRNAPYGL